MLGSLDFQPASLGALCSVSAKWDVSVAKGFVQAYVSTGPRFQRRHSLQSPNYFNATQLWCPPTGMVGIYFPSEMQNCVAEVIQRVIRTNIRDPTAI